MALICPIVANRRGVDDTSRWGEGNHLEGCLSSVTERFLQSVVIVSILEVCTIAVENEGVIAVRSIDNLAFRGH